MSAFEPRTYRQRVAAHGLVGFRVVVGETDLHVQVTGDEDRASGSLVARQKAIAGEAAREARRAIEAEIALRREFLTSLAPLEARDDAPDIARSMYVAGRRAGVGPMAAVAGAIAEFVGRRLLEDSREVIVENGGDIFLSAARPRTAAVFAGHSPLSYKIGIKIPAGETLAVCTSSGTVGHSHSEGKADAAVIIANDAAFADAMATALGNRVKTAEDIEAAVSWASDTADVRQALVVLGDQVGIAGEFEVEGIGDRG